MQKVKFKIISLSLVGEGRERGNSIKFIWIISYIFDIIHNDKKTKSTVL